MTTPSAAKFFGDLSRTHYQAVGGTREALLGVTTAFYSSVLADPILTVLFKSKGPEHAHRLMLFMLYFMEVSDEYFSERGSFRTLHTRHAISQRYPERLSAPPGAGCPGRGFTVSQRDAWKRHFVDAFREKGGLRDGLLQDMADFVDRAMDRYGPFEADRQ